MEKFVIGEAFRFGWQKMKEHFWFFAGLFVVTLIVQGLQDHYSKIPFGKQAYAPFLTLCLAVLNIIMQIGMIRIALYLHDGQAASFPDLFSQWRLFFKYIFSAILYGLIVFGGLLLLIVPGIMWGVRFQFYAYYVIDKNAGPMEALELSSKATKGSRRRIFLFDLACFGVAILGFLALILGLFAAIPTIMMATAYVYRKLDGQLAPVLPAVEVK